jgi:hypothetical protein
MNIRKVHSPVFWFIDVEIAFGILKMEKVIYSPTTLGNFCCRVLARIRCLKLAMRVKDIDE